MDEELEETEELEELDTLDVLDEYDELAALEELEALDEMDEKEELEELDEEVAGVALSPPEQPASATRYPVSMSPRITDKFGRCLNMANCLGNAGR